MTDQAPTPAPAPTPIAATEAGGMFLTATVHHWVADALPELSASRQEFANTCLQRHLDGDDGDLDEEDKAENEKARQASRWRVLSAYLIPEALRRPDTPDEKIWIITQMRSDTTVLFPSDY